MNKTLIIIGREFSTRVRKKSFLILTIFIPFFFTGFYAFLMWMLLKEDAQERKIAIFNQSSLEYPIEQIHNTTFEYQKAHFPEKLASDFLQQTDYYAAIWIPEHVLDKPEISIYSFSQIPVDLKNAISLQLQDQIEAVKQAAILSEVQIPDLKKRLASTYSPVEIKTLKISTDTKIAKENSSEIISIFSMLSGFVIYFFILMYASQVMKGVIEEKTNRIVEIVISSVKPFQFLLGKIIGVALVGLLQFFIWVILGFILIISIRPLFISNVDMDMLQNMGNLSAPIAESYSDLSPTQMQLLQNIKTSMDMGFIVQFLGYFLFYFVAGYLLYASMFAAIGAASDNDADSQQLLTPLSLILVLGLYIGFTTLKNPDSSIVFWSSLLPFTSPIVMLVRIPFGVPGWEIVTSMGLLVASFIFLTWLSGKIYRIGILMYGKKVTWKELCKWIRYK